MFSELKSNISKKVDRILSFLFFFTIFQNHLSFGNSINPPIIDTHSIHLQCSELLRDDRTLRFKTHFFNSLVLINGSVGYYNPVGTLHLFEIHFDSIPKVILLKNSPYNGHNFSRHLFMYNRNLYSLGGGGLFNTNSKLLKYDFIYLWRTYKFLIFPAVAVLFAFASPLTAKYINELLALLTTTTGGDPLIVLPDPVIQDSYAQYLSNLYEIFLIVCIFVSVSVFMRDKNKGLLPLVLSKPINRTNYLLSKLS